MKGMRSYIGLKLLIGSVLISLVAFGIASATAYCDGRWALAVGPETFIDKCLGFFAWMVLFLGLAHFFRLATNWIKFVSFCLGITLLLGAYLVKADFMLGCYFAGFQKSVFSAASIEQWKALPLIVKRNSMNSSNRRTMENLFPNFVWRVRPGVRFEGFPIGTNDPQISIIWRGYSFDPAIEVGPLIPSSSDYGGGIKCKENYSNSITIMLLGSTH